MSENRAKETFLKKYWKVIASFAVIFALLGTAYFVIENYDPTPKPAEETPAPQISLLSLDASLVSQVEIRNISDAFTLVKNEGVWSVKNAVFSELQQDRAESLAYSAATLSATRFVKTTDDMSAYGLKKPQSTVKITSQNGTVNVFHIGNITPAGDGYYAAMDGTNDVYILATGTAGLFCSPLDVFRVLTVTALNHTQIRTLSITSGNETLKLTYEAPPEGAYPGSVSTWRMESPLACPASNDVVLKQILSPISNLTAVSVVEDNPKDLQKYGFTGDSVTIITETDTVKFSVGCKEGIYYIMMDGKAAVYKMGTVLPFMELSPFDLVEKETNLIPLDTVEKIELILPGAGATLRVETEGEEMKFFINEKAAAEDKFKYFYMEIAGLSVDGIAKNSAGMNAGSPEASIVYTLTDGTTTTLSYYPFDAFNYALYENGECTFYIKKTRISNLASSLQKFIQNPNG